MRKVKLLALLLAVLMVVTAFAGCANTDVIESDVANLDERVTALENLLNGIDKEIDDVTAKIESVDQQIADLKDTVEADKTAEEIAALEKQLADQKAALEAQKAAAEEAKKAAEEAKTAAEKAAADQKAAAEAAQKAAAEQKAATEAAQKAAEEAKKAAEQAAADQKAANEALLQQIQNILNQQQADKDAAAQVLANAKTAALAKIATIETGLAGKYADLVAAAKAAVNAATTENACDKAVTDLEAAIAAADAAASAAVLAAAQKAASEEIEAIRAAKKDEKGLYLVEEYDAVIKALAAAGTGVAAAKTATEVATALETLKAELAKYAAIDDKLYDYFTKLWNNLTEDNRALNTEAQAYLEKVYKQIEDAENGNSVMTVIEAMSLAMAIESYVYGKGEDGFDDKIDLVDMLEGINRVYVTGATTDVIFAAADYNAITDPAGVTVYSLAKAKAEAEKLDARIKDFMTNSAYKETYAYYMKSAASALTVKGLMTDYDNWAKFVKPLAESNLALLTRAADFNQVKKVYDNYVKAAAALVELGTFDYANRQYIDIFAVNGWTTFDTVEMPFYNPATAKYATPTIFAPINSAISTWKSTYGLKDADVDDIILEELGYCYADAKDYAGNTVSGSPAVYKTVADYVANIDKKYESFKTDIVPLVKALNAEKYIQTSAYKAYADLKKALDSWCVITAKKVFVNETNYDLIVALSGVNENYEATATNYNKPLDLVTFANTDVETFFTTTLVSFETEANLINAELKNLKKDFDNRVLFSDLPLLAIEDKVVYLTKDNANVYVDRSNIVFSLENGALVGDEYKAIHDKDSSTLDASVNYTIYEFEQWCIAGDGNGVAYEGLADYLIDYKALSDLKTAFANRIEQLKADGATAFKTALGKVEYVTLYTDATAPGLRDETSKFAASSTGTTTNKIYYVTLADEATVKAVSDIYYNWVHEKGGNSKYDETVSTTFKLTVSGEKVSYSGGYKYVDILGDGNYDIYGNIIAQMATLTEARDAIVADFKAVAAALALGAQAGENEFLPKDLTSAAFTTYKYASSKHTYTQIVLETASEITVTAVDALKVADSKTEATLAPATGNDIETLIEALSDAYVAFEALNTNYDANAKASSEKYLEKDADVKATMTALKLLYAQNRIINDYLAPYVTANKGTASAEIVKQAIEGVANSTKLEGNYASSVQYWVEEVDDIVGAYPTTDDYKLFGSVFFTVGEYSA